MGKDYLSDIEKANNALDEFKEVLARELHIYDILDWINKKLSR